MELTLWSIHLIIHTNYPCYLLTSYAKKENEQIGLEVESIWLTFSLPSNGSVLDTNHCIMNLKELLDERTGKVKAVQSSDHVSGAAKRLPTASSVTHTHEITVCELSKGKNCPKFNNFTCTSLQTGEYVHGGRTTATSVSPLTLVMGEDNGKNAASASGSPLAGENKFDVIKKFKEKQTIYDMSQFASAHKPCGVVGVYTLRKIFL